MSDRRRLVHLALEHARALSGHAEREIRDARHGLGMSQRVAARRAGMSPSEYGRIERGGLRSPSIDQLCRAGRAVGLKPSLTFYPADIGPRDRPQLAVLDRFEKLLAPPLRLRREVPLLIPGDQRAWDARIEAPDGRASVEAESKLHDTQAIARRIALKQRDDPLAGVVIMVVNRTAHNRRVLGEHREALRAQFPLDGAAIARALRAGRLPAANGIILV